MATAPATSRIAAIAFNFEVISQPGFCVRKQTFGRSLQHVAILQDEIRHVERFAFAFRPLTLARIFLMISEVGRTRTRRYIAQWFFCCVFTCRLAESGSDENQQISGFNRRARIIGQPFAGGDFCFQRSSLAWEKAELI